MPNDIVIIPGSKTITFQDGSNTVQRLSITGSGLKFTGAITSSKLSVSNNLIIDGNLGIGTSSPSAKLHVTSSATTTAAIFQGNVGVGTTSTTGMFEIYKSTPGGLGGTLILNNDGTVVANETAIIFGDGNVNNRRAAISSTTEGSPYYGDIKFKTGLSAYGSLNTRMIILGNGNVGIGTSSPITKLDVRSGYITAGTGTSTSGTVIIGGYYGDGNLTILGTEYSSGGPMLGYGVTPSTTSGGAFLSSTGVNVYRSAYIQDGAVHRWYTGGVSTTAIGSPVSLSERMRITNDGNLGIGTTSVGNKLYVNGDGYFASTLYIADNTALNFGNISQIYHNSSRSATQFTGTGGADTMCIKDSNGYVGIGTTSPNRKLQIDAGTGGPALRLTNTNSNSGIELITAASTYSWLLGAQYNVGGAFEITPSTAVGGTTFSTPTAVFLQTGNVGIGTISPSRQLEIYNSTDGYLKFSGQRAGNSSYTIGNDTYGFIVYDDTNNVYRLTINKTTGNVGIGTVSPTAKLHVSASATTTALYLEGNALLRNDGVKPFGISLASAGENTFFLNHSGSGNTFHLGNDVAGRQYTTMMLTAATGVAGGNVGIGTTSPAAKLHVTASNNVTALEIQGNFECTGSIFVRGVLGQNNSTNFASAKKLTFNNDYNDVARGPNKIVLYNDGGSWLSGFGIASDQTMYYTGGNHIWYKSTSQTAFSEFMRLDTVGNLGIGTTSAATKLTTYVGSGFITGTNDAIRLQVSGYNDAARNTLVWAQDSSNLVLGRFGLEWNNSTSQMNFVWRDMYNGGVGSTELMRFTGGGNLGIGTTTPRRKLDVSGSFRATGLTSSVAIATQMDKDVPTVDSQGTFRRRTYITASAKTTNFLLTNTEEGYYLRSTSATNISCSIRTNATHPIPTNAVYTIFQVGAGTVTVTGSGVVINGSRTTAGQYKALQIIKVGTNTYDVIGGA